jgi:hypothetical protein
MPRPDEDSLPTIDYERLQKTIHDIEFTLFNLGGQTAFLDRFLGELSEFMFSGVASLIFSVDVVKVNRIARAKKYFDQALEKLNHYSPRSSVFLFLHKQDLLPEAVKEEVNQTIADYMLKDVTNNVRVFHTTVYDNSLFQAMDVVFRGRTLSKYIQIYPDELLKTIEIPKEIISKLRSQEEREIQQEVQEKNRKEQQEKHQKKHLIKNLKHTPREIIYRDESGAIKKKLLPND